MKKMSQSTCVECHYIFPRNEMQQRVYHEASGRGVGLSKNLKSGSVTRASIRQSNRITKKWVCIDCNSKLKNKDYLSNLFYIIVILFAVYYFLQ